MSIFSPGLNDLRRIGLMQEDSYRNLKESIGQADYYRNLYRDASKARMQPLERIAQKGFEDVEAYGRGEDVSKRRPQEFATIQKATDLYKNISRMGPGGVQNLSSPAGMRKIQQTEKVALGNLAAGIGGNIAATEAEWRDKRLKEALGAQATLLGQEGELYRQLPSEAIQQKSVGLSGAGSLLSGQAAITEAQRKAREDEANFILGLGKTLFTAGMG